MDPILHQADFVVSVVNPKQAHDFAKAIRQPGKSDLLDAQALAQLAAKLQPPAWTPPPAVYAQLAQRIAERDDLVNIRTQLLNQLHALAHEQTTISVVLERKQAIISLLNEQITTIGKCQK